MTHSVSTAVMLFPLGLRVRSSDEHTPENVVYQEIVKVSLEDY